MPNRIGPSVPGARAAREFILKAERLAREAHENGEPVSVADVAHLLELYLSDSQLRRGFLLALSEYLSEALVGNIIKAATWIPLENYDRQHRAPPLPIKRF